MDGSPRKIIHIDMDAFFAAVEQRDNPAYRNKPVVVGGRPDSRGVVATCSYEARRFGIHSAMASAHAYRLCPQAIFVKPRFAAYQEASTQIRAIFRRHSQLIEPLSLDEAYLDVSNSRLPQGSATLLAKQIKQEILHSTGLTASAGISYNKFLAKIASDRGKPDGLFLISPEQGPEFIESLPIRLFHGVGKATEKRMQALGILTGKDLKRLPLPTLQQHFGKSAQFFYDIARGQDHRPVNGQRIRKSVGMEITYAEDIANPQTILEQLQQLLQRVLCRLAESGLTAHTLTIKIKYHDFVQITRGRSFRNTISPDLDYPALFAELLKDTAIGKKKVRLLGVSLSGLNSLRPESYRQLDLFETT